MVPGTAQTSPSQWTAALHGRAHLQHPCGFLQELTAVVVLQWDENGCVQWGNRGFWRLHNPAGHVVSGLSRVQDFLVMPSFAQLQAVHTPPGVPGPLFQGLLTLCDAQRVPHPLVGAIWRLPDKWVLVAEFDVVQLERLNAEVLTLNEELSQAQRELARANRALQVREAELRALSSTDALTGVANRRHLMERLEQVWQGAQRYQQPFTVVMADIDHFKNINDTHGHAVGDTVLRAVAQHFAATVRASDVVGRYGGEEFMVVLPNTAMDDALELAQRLRSGLHAVGFDEFPAGVRCSFGAAQWHSQEDTMASVLRAADLALYQAKAAGRDCIRVGSGAMKA